MELLHISGGASLPRHDSPGGTELFVIEGAAQDSDGSYKTGSWLRLPPGAPCALRSKTGCTLYSKRGHLAAQN